MKTPLYKKYFVKMMERVVCCRETGCWLWTGAQDNDGRGNVRINNKVVKAPRAMWEVLVGPIPEGLNVLHRCDTPRCCNPQHLWLGTHKQNMSDMSEKDRASRHQAKIGLQEAAEIKALICMGHKLARIAADYGISPGAVWAIKAGKNWRKADTLRFSWPPEEGKLDEAA